MHRLQHRLPADYKDEECGNYTVSLIPGVDVGRAYGFNPTYEDDKPRAVQRLRFRRAMSLALDRDELNEVYFLGLGRPSGYLRLAAPASTSRIGSGCGPSTILRPAACSTSSA